jgi:U3 small nucleolar RNA-associated protein MPP10
MLQDVRYTDFFDPPPRPISKSKKVPPKKSPKKTDSSAPADAPANNSPPPGRKVRFMNDVKVKEIAPRRLTALEREAIARGVPVEDLHKEIMLSQLLDENMEGGEGDLDFGEEDDDDDEELEGGDSEEEEEEDDEEEEEEAEGTEDGEETIDRLKGDLFANADDAQSADGEDLFLLYQATYR